MDSPATPLFVLSLSGGLDSAVLCADLLAKHGHGAVFPVFFDYGSKHNPWEKKSARAVAAHYGLLLAAIDLSAAFAGLHSALLAADPRDIPAASYTARSMSQTVVPGRNLIFGAVLAALAESRSIPAVALATHGGDHHLYPDCRPAFNAALAEAASQSSGGAVRIVTPFAALSKADIVGLGLRLGAPLHLTRSCYAARETSCGVCGTCRERLEAFARNGAKDPVPYSALDGKSAASRLPVG